MGPGFESLTSHQYNQGLTNNRRPFLLPKILHVAVENNKRQAATLATISNIKTPMLPGLNCTVDLLPEPIVAKSTPDLLAKPNSCIYPCIFMDFCSRT
jgi:hypothetical protein